MISVYDKVITWKNPFVMFYKKPLQIFTLYHFFFLLQSGWVWALKIIETSFLGKNQKWDFIMLYLQLKKPSSKKPTPTVAEMQQLRDIEKTNPDEEFLCSNSTFYNSGRNVCVNFKTNTVKLNFVVYSHRNNSYLKDERIDLKLIEH